MSHTDTVIIGAGISGIGAALRMRADMPEKDIVVYEAHDDFGGTWWLHRYPGARTDSDMQTYGYAEYPWHGKTFALSGQIKTYMKEAMDKYNLDSFIKYNRKVANARWDNIDKKWLLTIINLKTLEKEYISTNYIWNCGGYYNHQLPHRPHWRGEDTFKGVVTHAQLWDERLSIKDKNIIVIGSGATAATIIPAMANDAQKVTMLQRSPTFFYSKPSIDPLKEMLDPLDIPPMVKHDILRKHFIKLTADVVEMAKNDPDQLTTNLLEGVKAALPDGFDMRHFTPHYKIWRQRVAAIPDGDFFAAVRDNKADVVTGIIKEWYPDGIRLEDGTELPADIIVLATGLNMNVLGEIEYIIDKQPLDLSKKATWMGLLIEDIPNMFYHFGYFRASWTLRVELVNNFVMRLRNYMEHGNYNSVCARRKDGVAVNDLRPWVESDNVNAGYMMRALPYLFKQSLTSEWSHFREYKDEVAVIKDIDFSTDSLEFS